MYMLTWIIGSWNSDTDQFTGDEINHEYMVINQPYIMK